MVRRLCLSLCLSSRALPTCFKKILKKTCLVFFQFCFRLPTPVRIRRKGVEGRKTAWFPKQSPRVDLSALFSPFVCVPPSNQACSRASPFSGRARVVFRRMCTYVNVSAGETTPTPPPPTSSRQQSFMTNFYAAGVTQQHPFFLVLVGGGEEEGGKRKIFQFVYNFFSSFTSFSSVDPFSVVRKDGRRGESPRNVGYLYRLTCY